MSEVFLEAHGRNIECTNCYWSGTINQKSWVGTFKPSSSSNRFTYIL